MWTAALVLAVGALAGGVLGGRVTSRIQPALLHWIVIAVGLVVAAVYFVR